MLILATTLAPISALSSGGTLNLNQALTSPEGCTLKISGGDLVLTDANGNVKWRAGVSGATTVINFDGLVLLINANAKVLWWIRGPPGSTLAITNCQLALTDSSGNAAWGSSSGYITTTTSKY